MLRGAGGSIAQVGAMLLRSTPPASFGMMADGGSSGATAIPAVDLVYLYNFPVPAMVVTSIFQRLQTVGAGSAVKCAVWANNPATGRPMGTPLFGQNAGFDTTAGTGIKSAAIASYSLNAAMYWFGSKATGTLPVMTSMQTNNNAQPASRTSFASASDAINFAGAQTMGFSVPDAYANDIMALNLKGATFTPVASSGIPVIGLGWA